MNTASTVAEEFKTIESPRITGKKCLFNAASSFKLNVDLEVAGINELDLSEDDLMMEEKPTYQKKLDQDNLNGW